MAVNEILAPVRWRFRGYAHAAAAILVAGLHLAGCDDPQEPRAPETGAPGAYDAQQQTLEFGVESTAGEQSHLRLVAREVRFDPQTRNVHALVSIRNDGNVAVAGPEGIGVFGFVPSDVRPVNADTCDAAAPDEANARVLFCVYSYAGSYGDDGDLAPNEVSEPVEWVLHDPSGESFAFRARIVSNMARGQIAGLVFEDRNGNGVRESSEPGIEGAGIVLQFGDETRTTLTNARGAFVFGIVEPGLYRVDKRAQPGWRITTAHPYEVVIVAHEDGSLSSFRGAIFGCQREGFPLGVPVMGVVYEDFNRNGQRDRGEPGIPGIEVHGATPLCPTFVPIIAVTGRDGAYEMRLPDCDPPFEVGVPRVRVFDVTSPNPVVFEHRPPAGEVLRADFGLARRDTTCSVEEADVVRGLARAYAARNPQLFSSLLARDAGAEFLFVLAEPTATGETAWGYEEEARIHRRMFEPQNTHQGEPPVPPELWPQEIKITLTQQSEFTERHDLYRDSANAQGLDPARWRATGARYATNVFWLMRGDVDYQVEGEANFVVIEDLQKRQCEFGKFLLYIWEDFGNLGLSADQRTWSAMKTLYR